MWPVVTLLFCLVCVTCFAEPPLGQHQESNQSAQAKEQTKPLAITFEDLSLGKALKSNKIPIDIEKQLPESITKLVNKTVTIRGWMFPPAQETEIPAFLLIRSSMLTNFGAPVRVDEKIGVKMKTGSTTDYLSGCRVTGTLKIRPKIIDGEGLFFYVIKDATVTEDWSNR